MGFFAGFWKFWPGFRNLSVGSGFLGIRGGKTETDPPESAFGGEDPPPTRRSSRVGWIWVGFGRFFNGLGY